MRVLFLTKYGPRAATTRFRVLQYVPYLTTRGFDVAICPLLNDAYLAAKYDRGRTPALDAIRGVIDRLRTLPRARRFSVVVVHMEALPYLPAFFERALNAIGVPYVYDFDDATFHQYDRHPSAAVRWLFSRKIGRVIAGAALVTAGNEYLAEYARKYNDRVLVVPTVVDVEKFVPRHGFEPRDKVVVGWIGSPSTATYVADRAQLWRTATADGRSVLRLIGAGRAFVSANGIETRAWREETEAAEISEFDIGIMPLRDDPWSRGKCGFKLIEYLACGVPVVASPVGVNSQIVADGVNGFLCGSDAEWVDRLQRLIADARLRRDMGSRGRLDVERNWSLQVWAPRLADALEMVVRISR
jgi:glycosyltransferase involved in cell wall biosynthesis